MNMLSSRALALTLALASAAAVQAQELVVGIFGGSFADDSKTCHISEFEKKTGAKVQLKLGSSSQFAAAVRATGGKSDFDVVYIDNSLATQLKNEKLLETIDRGKRANAGMRVSRPSSRWPSPRSRSTRRPTRSSRCSSAARS